jgi:glycosyltransferase involved in cell wall biosynthesis
MRPSAPSWRRRRLKGRALVSPELSIIICSLNGASGVDRCLHALAAQTIRSSLELIIVDDGSTDATSEVGRAHGAIVIRHGTNLGLAAARNSGVGAATAPVVAFLDDDCEPEPQWAEQLMEGYEAGATGVGGPILPRTRSGFMSGYLERNNPLKPQELNLAASSKIVYRFSVYLRRQWTQADETCRREVYSFAGANMSFRREAVVEAGEFDERFRFGGEEQDLCMRIIERSPPGMLLFVPGARVAHHFEPSLHDTLRRSRAYGRGLARLYRKWPSVPITIFPGPFVVLAMLSLASRNRPLALAAVAVPHLLYPRGLRHALATRTGASLLDAYVQLAQEAFGNVGFIDGLWRFRHLVPEVVAQPTQPREARERIGSVS